MNNIMTVSISQHLDIEKINAMTDPVIEVKNQYAPDRPDSNLVNLAEFNDEEKKAFFLILPKLTAPMELGNYVFKIIKTDKQFDLSGLYVIEETETIPDGTTLMARFEIPGFEVNNFREIPLYFNTDLDPADLVLLQEIGITLIGNGLEFQIANEVECKVSFFKPDASEVDYIIDFPMFNEIIPADE